MHSVAIVVWGLTTLVYAESILTTEVFIIPISPDIFDWSTDERYDGFSYKPSLVNAPDLPSWIHYTYSKRNHYGVLYGVAPKHQNYFQLEIVGLNRHTYETRYKVLDINVLEKENITKYGVHLKIDNLNIEDMFDHDRTEKLLNVFRKKLWKNAADLYVTFLASAVELGARLPLKPTEGEGVIIRLGSSVPFSQELNELQEEVRPLWKLPSCPREFKRTSVEILFREAGFTLDWCSFRLLEECQQDSQHGSARRGSDVNSAESASSEIFEYVEWRWARPKKTGVPTRSYFREIATTIFVPAILLLLLAAVLSTTFCLHYDKIEGRESLTVEGSVSNTVQMVQYALSEKGTLKSLSAQPSSPNNSLARSGRCSRWTGDRGNPYLRPNPPPYIGPSNLGSDIQTDC